MLQYKLAAAAHVGFIVVAAAAEPSNPLSWLGTLGSAGAAVVITYLFLQDKKEDRKTRREEQKAFMEALERREERADKQRKDFSDVLKHYREESTRAATHGTESLRAVTAAVHELKDTVHLLKDSHKEMISYIERAYRRAPTGEKE